MGGQGRDDRFRAGDRIEVAWVARLGIPSRGRAKNLQPPSTAAPTTAWSTKPWHPDSPFAIPRRSTPLRLLPRPPPLYSSPMPAPFRKPVARELAMQALFLWDANGQ